MEERLRELTKKAQEDERVLAVILFGSYLTRSRHRDIDACIVLKDSCLSSLFLSKKRLEFLEVFPEFDIRVYQQLPIYIRMRVLAEGKIIFCRDEDAMYDLAIRETREFGYYKPIYEAYLEEILLT